MGGSHLDYLWQLEGIRVASQRPGTCRIASADTPPLSSASSTRRVPGSWRVYELPPNGQGLAALMMLNLMEVYPLKQFGHNSTNALHVMIEAKKIAYADLLKYIGDPRMSKAPVAGMLSKGYARERAQA